MPLSPANQLFDHLNLVRELAGNPPRDDLVQAGAGRLAEQGTDEILLPQGGNLPPWEFVAAYVAACHAAAFSMGRYTQQLGALPSWRSYYLNLATAKSEASCPLTPNCEFCTPGGDTQHVILAELPQELQTQRESASIDQSTSRLIENKAASFSASLAPPGTIMLVVLTEQRRGSSFLLDRDRVTLGRDSESDIFLDNVYVSRRHAEFIKTQEGFAVRDLESLCGTFVNGSRIKPRFRVRLENRDILDVGALKIVVLKKTV